MSGLQHWDLIPTVPFRFPSLEVRPETKRASRRLCLDALLSFAYLEAMMESAFTWLNTLVQTFYRFFPHILIVRATHGGVSVVHPVMWRPARFLDDFQGRCCAGHHIISRRQRIAIGHRSSNSAAGPSCALL